MDILLHDLEIKNETKEKKEQSSCRNAEKD